VHDNSKFFSPEKELFKKYTPFLGKSEYGSEEYFKFLEKLKPALEHHYKKNSHHPEFHENGIKGMSLLDLLEMLADWQAAVTRHNDNKGREKEALIQSIETNQKRFNYSDELKSILINTITCKNKTKQK
jgi:hypothetical protein